MPGRLLVIVALVLAACSPAERLPPRPADRIVVGTTEPIASHDPAACYDYACSRMLLANTHEGLVRFAAGTATPEASLAESWTVSPDGLVYTFTLRRDVVFHDGTPLTADLVKRSLERVRALASTDTAAFLLFDLANDPPRSGIVAIEAPAPEQVIVRLGRRDASFLSKLEFPSSSVVPASYPADAQGPVGTVVGTGPFRLRQDGFVQGESIELERNDRYWGEKAKLARVTIRQFRTSSALRDAVQSGEVDVAFRTLAPSQVDAMRRMDGWSAVDAPGAAVRFVAFNVGKEPFANAGFRRAVAAAIDRDDVVSRVLGTTASPLYSLVPAGLDGHGDAFRELAGKPAIDAELSVAGVPASPPAPVEIWYTPTFYGDTETAAAQAVEAALEATGRFDVTLRSAEWPDYKSAFARGDFGAYLLGWYPDYVAADAYVEPFVQSTLAPAVGVNYSDPEMDRLLADARASADPAHRETLFARIQDKLADDVPLVPLWQARQIAFVRTGVRGLRLDISQNLRLAPVEASSS